MKRLRNCQPQASEALTRWHQALTDRRTFLLGLAGGSLATLFGLPSAAGEAEAGISDPWPTLDQVQQHLLPSEPDAPGAHEINALAYLRFVVADPKVEASERRFILQGAGWLEDMAQQLHGSAFTALNAKQREAVLRRIAASRAGENWLSTLLYYLLEALLTDPVYGGNPGGVGWQWLEHTTGFPRPTPDKTYPKLLS